MSQVTELVTNFRFEGSTGPLTEYNSSLGSSIGLLAAMTASLFASGAAVGAWATNILQAFDGTEQLSRSTKEGVEFIQEMGFAASVNGSSIQAFQSSVEGLSRTIGEAAQKGSDDFARLGISVRDTNGQVKSTQQVMDEVRNSFSRLGLSMSEQRGFAEALGIDASMLQTLGLTSAAMADLRQQARDLGVLTGEQADQAIAYNDSVTVLRYGLNSLQLLMSVGLAPQLQEVSEYFTELLKNNKDWIIQGVQTSMKVLGEFLKMLERLAPFIAAFAAGFVAMKVAALGFSGILAIIASPIVVVTASIAAAALVLDDLVVAFGGGKSVIRDFFLEFLDFDIQPVLQGIVSGFNDMIDDLLDAGDGFLIAFGGIFTGIGKLITGDFEAALDDLTVSFNLWINTIVNLFENLFGDLFRFIGGQLISILPDWAIRLISDDQSDETSMQKIDEVLVQNINEPMNIIPDWFNNLFSDDLSGDDSRVEIPKEQIKESINVIPDWFSNLFGNDENDNSSTQQSSEDIVKPMAQSNGFTPGGNFNSYSSGGSSVEQTVNMEIRTNDPERAGQAAATGLQQQLQDARTNARRRGTGQ
jgi:hypothetical protein